LQGNKVEHRLFSHISMNWRGRPLVSHEVIVELIAATQTRSGLKVHAELDRGRYPPGVRISDQELAAVPLRRHAGMGSGTTRCYPPPRRQHRTNVVARGPLNFGTDGWT
jgi:Rhodopirellula transposase DDE domain